ncbi:MAG: HAD-IB family hydrolase [Bacteroidales bacterium]|nr:HAD-IB family hydrolase [Bacteroidales bacterium]
MKKHEYIAFYDLDHTILTGNSATYLVEESRNRGVMTSSQYRHAVWLSLLYKLNLGDPTKMINRMLSWLKDVRESEIKQLCEEIYHASIKKTIRPEILESLEMHRSESAAVVLLSSATTPICEPVAKHLELDDMICTHLEVNNGILNGTTDGKLVYGSEKKFRMLSFCAEHGCDPQKAWYYGDSHTDRHVMEAVGNPVAVSPDKRLKKIAIRRKWPILVDDR